MKFKKRIDNIIDRMLTTLEDKFCEDTYKELYEAQNIMLDKNKLRIKNQAKTISKLKKQILEMENAKNEK